MTVEQKKGNSMCEEDSNDRFPVGMRVLAVDDDPTCLRVLDTLLCKCQYKVTTTNQAIMALKMLRENKNNFDLVISDVRMPDMDGFKLLELVGLEMDLPVIMLSAYGDTELVMQGISHGACDYLLKPVRIEELKNIWQHVLRKKKFKTKDQKESHMQEMTKDEVGEDAHDPSLLDDLDQNRKFSRKRKDQDDYEYEDAEDEENESEDTANQKKARVVWSVELHQKFVAAVNQLGIDKAVPKKILDLMDVEGLTRENVASHLQKYRLYLKRISNVASQQANLVAALGKDSSYLRMASLEGYRDYRAMAGSGRLSNTALSSYFPSGMLGRLNTPVGLSARGLPSSDINQTSSNAIATFGKIQPATAFPSIQSSNLFQGIPTTLGIDQLQQNKSVSSTFGDFNNLTEASSFGVSSISSFQNSRTKMSNSNAILNTVSSNPLMLQGTPQNLQNTGGFGIQLSVSLNQESFKLDQIGSSNFLDHNRYNGSFGNQSSVLLNPGATTGSSSLLDHCRSNENWSNTAQFSNFSSSSLPLSQPFNHDALTSNSLNERIFPSGSKNQHNPVICSSNSAIPVPMDDLRAVVQNQAGLIDNVVQNQNFISKQRWENNSNHALSNLDSLHSTNGSAQITDLSTIGQLNGCSSSLAQHEDVNGSAMNTKMKATGGFLDQLQPNGDFAQTGFDSLDDLMSSMIKREHHETMLMDGEYGFDGYSLGSCI